MLIPRVPSTFVPSLVMPVFLTLSFSGQFSGLTQLPGFPATSIIDWFVPMTLIQGAAFAGITTGMGVARDLESGFYDRFLLSPAPRNSLLFGPLLASIGRAFIPITLLLLVAVLGRAHFRDGAMGVLVLVVAGLGVALAAGAWATALSLRFKTMQAAPLMQIGIFLTVFLSTAQMPLHLIEGWLHEVARLNPMTNVLALARQGFLGDVTWSGTWPGLLALAGMSALLIAFAARSLAKVTP
jgi:ABC-2 type transport system permease protein